MNSYSAEDPYHWNVDVDIHGKYTLHLQAATIQDVKDAALKLAEAAMSMEQQEKDQASAAAAERAKYFPGEKLTAPKGSDYTINDSIKLVARNQDADAVRVLQRWGAWWKVRAATKGGTAWLLASIQEQPRELSKKLMHELLMIKDLDPMFAVVAVLRYPTTFTYKLAEQGARINAS